MAAESGRILGLDVGERRIGVAISDPAASFALPLHSVTRDKQSGSDVASIRGLVQSEGVVEIVVGLPLTLSGETGPQAESSREFAEQLERALGIPVALYDERLSTREAVGRVAPSSKNRDRKKGRGGEADTDALAASIILQAYLDSKRLSRPNG